MYIVSSARPPTNSNHSPEVLCSWLYTRPETETNTMTHNINLSRLYQASSLQSFRSISNYPRTSCICNRVVMLDLGRLTIPTHRPYQKVNVAIFDNDSRASQHQYHAVLISYLLSKNNCHSILSHKLNCLDESCLPPCRSPCSIYWLETLYQANPSSRQMPLMALHSSQPLNLP